jgi:hypothetical protein
MRISWRTATIIAGPLSIVRLSTKRMAIRPARDRPGHALAEMQRGGALQSRINDDAAIKTSVI